MAILPAGAEHQTAVAAELQARAPIMPVFQMLLDGGTRLTTSHVTGIPIAEYVMRAVLDHFQQRRPGPRQRREQRWQSHDFREVHGTTWLVVGLGNIGTEWRSGPRRSAPPCSACGVRRTATRPSTSASVPTTSTPCCRGPMSSCSPRPAATTRAIFWTASGSRVPAGSVLVNVGRGSLVDEDALRTALDRGVPEVAILDVTEEEPPPEGSWLWDHPSVVLTPHSSAGGTGVTSALQTFRRQPLLLDEGEPLAYEVTAGRQLRGLS